MQNDVSHCTIVSNAKQDEKIELTMTNILVNDLGTTRMLLSEFRDIPYRFFYQYPSILWFVVLRELCGRDL